MAKELGAVPEPVADRYAKLLKAKGSLTDAEAKLRAKDNIEKIKLKRWADMARSKSEAEHAAAVKNARQEQYPKDALKNADQRFQDAKDKFTAGRASAPEWLNIDNVPQTDVAKEFVARIADLSDNQRNDPHVLYREAAKLYWSTEWTSTDMSSEGVKEVRGLLERTLKHIQEDLGPPSLDFGDARNDVLWKGLDRRFDFYRTHRLDLLPHVPDEAPKDRVTKKVNRDSPEYQKWAQQKEAELQRGKLSTLLRTSQDHLDKPEFQDLESRSRLLGQLEGSLRNGVRRSVKEHDIAFAEFDEKEAQPFIHKIKAEKNEVDTQLYKARQAEERKRRFGTPEKGASWIDEATMKDTSGKEIKLENDTFIKGVQELREISQTGDWALVTAKITELLGQSNSLGGTDLEYLNRLWSKAAEHHAASEGSHWNPTADEQYRLQTSTKERDKKFYELIAKVLDNPNEEAYKQFDLYDKFNYDLFQKIIGRTTMEIDGKRVVIGDKLVAHYQNLFDTIMRLSDADYWASSPLGDVESLQKNMNFFRNGFAIEAISDPIAAQMMSCYEQAIEFVRDMHDQYLPNELFSVHAARYEIYIDKLAEEFLRRRVEAGSVFDIKRNEKTGLPELDHDQTKGKKIALQENPLTIDDLDSKDYFLRVKAARRMAKGMGIMTLRLTETMAFTRTPGVEVMSDGFNGDFTQKIAGFSSKPYGGITRWHNPMAEWLRMYGFGDTLFVPFFNAMAGFPEGEVLGTEKRALGWSMEQVIDVMNIAETGDRELLESKYGKGVIRLMDKVEEFSFSGREGPLSMWGTMDSTLGWNDLDRERVGGSMRLSMIQGIADSIIEKEFRKEYETQFERQFNDKKYKDTVRLQTEWLNAKLGLENWKSDPKWKEKVDNYARTYKTWVWTQYIMRNPQGAAAHIFVDYGQKPDGKPYRAKLKSKIFHEIFQPSDLEGFGLPDNKLIIERDIATGRELTDHQYSLMERMAILDGDLMAVQSYAMDSGKMPRDITDEDFEKCIKGKTRKLTAYTEAGKANDIEVDVATRRRQAKEYFKKVQREFFGKAIGDSGSGWDANDWRSKLHATWDTKGNLTFAQPEKINDVYEAASKENPANRLSRKVVDKKIQVHMGTEDVQWRYLEWNILGERHWGRRGNDFLTRAKTEQMSMEYFHMLTAKPDQDKLVEALQKMGMNEKGHDPKEAAKRVHEWGVATNEIYRQRLLGGMPFAGRILPHLPHIGPIKPVPMSIVQERFGPEIGVAWSANNSVQFAEKIGATRIIPYKRIMDGKDFGPYTMQTFWKDARTSRLLAATEMFIIGYAIALVLTAGAAATKSVEEESKH